MRGAKITSAKVKPDLAILFEGSPADDRYFPEELPKALSAAALKFATWISPTSAVSNILNLQKKSQIKIILSTNLPFVAPAAPTPEQFT